MLRDTALSWEMMVRTAQDLFARYAYEPIYTPLFEHTEVFTRGIGEATDIVSKEMYTFEDRAGRSLTLRPEGTASVVRAALEHGLVQPGSSAKLYYAGPMFRYERPQKGRTRQFWQIGLEALGMAEPSIDAEVIQVLMRFFEAVGIPRSSMRLLLNSMGDEHCRPAYRDTVAAYIREHGQKLCGECNRRAETNPLRAFDCKNESCQAVMGRAPLLKDELCEECADHYSAVKRYLEAMGIDFVEDPRLVRGLDYYTRTVFEVQVDVGLGSQNAIGGGGRYDYLMQAYGGPATPGLGFALGFERTLLALQAANPDRTQRSAAQVYVARVDATVASTVFEVVAALRDSGISTEMDHQARSLKSQFKQADRCGARYTVVVGPDELVRGQVTVRRMSDSGAADADREILVALDGLVEHFSSLPDVD
jgi:histidyl-tRNA synthetase